MNINQNALWVLLLSVIASGNDVDLANNTNFLILLFLILENNNYPCISPCGCNSGGCSNRSGCGCGGGCNGGGCQGF